MHLLSVSCTHTCSSTEQTSNVFSPPKSSLLRSFSWLGGTPGLSSYSPIAFRLRPWSGVYSNQSKHHPGHLSAQPLKILGGRTREGSYSSCPRHPCPPHGWEHSLPEASLCRSPSPGLKVLILPLSRSHVSVSTPGLWLKTVQNWEAVQILDSPCKLTKLPATVSWRLADNAVVLGQRQGT